MVAQFFQILESFFSQLFAVLAKLSLLELLKVLAMLVVVLLVVLVFFKISLFIMKNTVQLLQVTLKFSSIIVLILGVLYWLTSPVRPCLFEAEAYVTNCSTSQLHDGSKTLGFADIIENIKTWWNERK